MARRGGFVVFIVFFLSTLTNVQMQSSPAPDHQQEFENMEVSESRRLLDELFNKRQPTYNRVIRPVKDDSTPVNITHQVILTDIIAVDEKEHRVELNIWWRLSWRDEFLTWNPKDFGGKNNLIIPASLIWLPDLQLYNSLEVYGVYGNPGNTQLSSDGTIFWSVKILIVFHCGMVLTNFPFDDQHCELRLGSWSYSGSLIDLYHNAEEPFDTYTEFHENGEWDLVDTSAYRKENRYKVFSNASDPNGYTIETWPELYLTMTFRRKYRFYFLTLLLPYFLISALSGLVFVIQSDTGEKMGLATTILLALVVFNEYVTDIVPPNADHFPLLGDYFVIMMFWVGMSVIMSACVLHMYHQDPKNCKWMGPYMRYLVFGFMARVVRDSNTQGHTESESEFTYMGNASMEAEQGEDADRIDLDQVRIGKLDSDVRKIRQLLEGEKKIKEVDDLLKDAGEAPLQEWREAVRIIDKFFFWVYTIINALLMFGFLLFSIFYSL